MTAKYGFTNGTANVTVTASNAATCPDGTTTCYSVTITKKLPLIFSPVFGFAGNTTIGGANAELITATAIASYQTSPRNYCILALASSGPRTSAVEFRRTAAQGGSERLQHHVERQHDCNGHDLQADYGDAHGTNSGCGNMQTSNMPQVTDPYAARASNIPANTCSSYPQRAAKGTLPVSNLWSGTKSFGTKTYCGDVQLTGNVTLTGDNVIVIRNGQLDRTASPFTHECRRHGGERIIFSGETAATLTRRRVAGTMNINSPTTGNWAGVALYTDPSLTTVSTSAQRVTARRGTSRAWPTSRIRRSPSAASSARRRAGTCFVLVVDTHPLQRHRGDAQSRRMRSAGAGDAQQPDSHPRQIGGLSHVEDLLSHEAAPRRQLGPRDDRVRARRDRADRRPAQRPRGRALVAQKMEMANAVNSATLAAWNACDTKHLPAKTNCTGLTSAITTGLQTTSLGTSVTLASGYPTEGYYCVNSSGVLTNVANYSATPPATCSGAGRQHACAGRLCRDPGDLQLHAAGRQRAHRRQRAARDVHFDRIHQAEMTMMRTFKRLLRNDEGAAAIEFAIYSTAFFAMLFGGIYASILGYTSSSLHAAVESAARCRAMGTTCTDAATTQNFAAAKFHNLTGQHGNVHLDNGRRAETR